MSEQLRGYSPLKPAANSFTNQSFDVALLHLKAGGRVARAGWNGKKMWLALQVPDENSKMQRPYIYMSPADGKLVPWLASQADLLEHDWESVSG